MNSHQAFGNRLMLLFRNWKARNFSPARRAARRKHDRAMSDRSIPVAHQIQVARAIERSHSGRTLCRPHMLTDERYTEIRGVRLRISVEGAGAPLLLFNGLGANIELWQPLRSLLPSRQTIAFDPPGVGGSPRVPRRLRMQDLADIVSELLTELGHDSVDVLGYSLGGAVAQQFARQHRRRVRRLVLAATTPGVGAIQNPVVLMQLAALAMRRDTPGRRAAVARVVGGNVSRDSQTLAWVERAHRIWPLNRMGMLDQVWGMTGWSSLPWLHKLEVPTLVLAGEQDPLVPPVNTRIFVSRMPSCQWHLVPAAGHLFLIDQAKDVAGVIEEFLSDTSLPELPLATPSTVAGSR